MPQPFQKQTSFLTKHEVGRQTKTNEVQNYHRDKYRFECDRQHIYNIAQKSLGCIINPPYNQNRELPWTLELLWNLEFGTQSFTFGQVNEAFHLLDPQNAREFLKGFDAATGRKGEAAFRQGHVQELIPKEAGKAYAALVKENGKVNEVELHYDLIDGWEGSCSCAEKFPCQHLFAAMRSLLAEHSTAAVRNLSAGKAAPSAPWTKPSSKGQPEAGTLARRLLVALGRPLNAEETRFVRKVMAAFTRCQQTSRITHWDFQEMGLPLGGHGWEGVPIWPAFPKDEFEFWLYVANAAIQHGLMIPPFMEPITDLTGVQERLTHWRRTREVERWKKSLDAARIEAQPPNQSPDLTDLRLMIGPTEAYLEWRRQADQSFQPIKQNQFPSLVHDYREDLLRFTPEAELIWQLFASRLFLGINALRYQDNEAASILRRLLRMPQLHEKIFTATGQLLARPAESLRWQLSPADSEQEDYRLRLVQADGSQPPPILCTMTGNPTLYLTANAVFTGPRPKEPLLNSLKENRIPAPALESPAGLEFLLSLGLELPPRVRDRVRTLPFQILIKCRLEPIYAGSAAEDCVVSVLAEAPDGHQQLWTGYNWLDSTPEEFRKKVRPDGPITVYDRAAIAAVPALLQPLNLKSSTYGSGLALRVTKKFPEIFAAWLKTIPPQITVQLEGELASFAGTDVSGQVKLEVTEAEIDWFDLRVVLNVTDTTLSQEEIKLLLNAKGGYVRLKGKGWRRLQFDLTEDENERLARLGLSPRGLSAEPQRLHALQLADEAAKKFLPEHQVEQVQRRSSEIKARVAPDLPAKVTAQLRPYQMEGFHFLAYLATNHFGGILADDMGLGKTLQALSWLVWLRNGNGVRPPSGAAITESEHAVKNSEVLTSAKAAAPEDGRAPTLPSLVVCPKSVMDNWHVEAERFTPGLRVKAWPANELAYFTNRIKDADLHVLNYNQLRLLGESLGAIRWQAVILDEGQYIKNPSSQTAQVARALRAEHRLVLSGTPIENRLLDLWSLMAFAMPGVLGSRAQFARLYDAKDDPFARRRLASRVRPFLLRRTKAQVAKDLPDRVEEDLFCDIEGEQKTLYRAELKRAQQILLRIKTQKELAQQQFHFLTSLLRLRQICCHPRLLNLESTAPSAKSEALLEQLEPLMDEGQKVLVFSQFVELLALLRPSLVERGWPVFYLVGETENRGELVKKFQAAEGPGVFLISLKAGGFGLNLTAASYVILFDPWWNPAVEAQAIDRTHRIGQVNKVMAYRLLIKDSIEEKIRSLQKQKQALVQDVLGEERFAQNLTLEDLHFLLAD